VHGHHAELQLCPWCLTSLPWRTAPDLDMPGFERAFAPLAYEGAARAWVLKAKHERGLIAARMLGGLLAETLCDAYPFPSDRPDRLIPVPLSSRRLRWRGHNQAVLLAAPVSRRLRIPLARRAARRIRHTPVLADLAPEARADTVDRAFSVSSDMAGARVAIIDDVVTTGSTARALAAALREAGVREIHLWAVTAAEHPD
jgi:ComF family protein